MDVSPQLLHDVHFREQWRGYNPDEVDDFLERVAVALGQLQEQLAEALARATRAERRVLDGSTDEGELQRTLILAQRTADAALEEARQRAAELISDAEANAVVVGREADEWATAVTGEADERAARVVAEAEGRVASELAPLLAQRGALQDDVEALRAWAAEIRARMADELRQQLTWLEGSGADLPPAPEVLAMDLPEPQTDATMVDPFEEQASGAAGAEDDTPPPWSPDHRGEAFSPSDPEATGIYDALADDDGDHHDPDHGGADGPLAMAAADDPFLAELRRAVTDDEPLGPRDHVVGEVASDEAGHDDAAGEGGRDDDLSPAPMFRRRGRR